MEILTNISLRYTDESREEEDEEDPSDTGDDSYILEDIIWKGMS